MGQNGVKMLKKFFRKTLSLLVIMSHLTGQTVTVGCHGFVEIDDTLSISITPLMGGVDILSRVGPGTPLDGKLDPDFDKKLNLTELNRAIEIARLKKLPEIEQKHGKVSVLRERDHPRTFSPSPLPKSQGFRITVNHQSVIPKDPLPFYPTDSFQERASRDVYFKRDGTLDMDRMSDWAGDLASSLNKHFLLKQTEEKITLAFGNQNLKNPIGFSLLIGTQGQLEIITALGQAQFEFKTYFDIITTPRSVLLGNALNLEGSNIYNQGSIVAKSLNLKARGYQGSPGRIKNFIGGIIGGIESLDLSAQWITNLGKLGTTSQSEVTTRLLKIGPYSAYQWTNRDQSQERAPTNTAAATQNPSKNDNAEQIITITEYKEKSHITSSIFGNGVSGELIAQKESSTLNFVHLGLETAVLSNLGSIYGDRLNLTTHEGFQNHKGATQFYGKLLNTPQGPYWQETDTPQPVSAEAKIDVTYEGQLILKGNSKNKGIITSERTLAIKSFLDSWCYGDNLLENEGIIQAVSSLNIYIGNLLNKGQILVTGKWWNSFSFSGKSLINMGILDHFWSHINTQDFINYRGVIHSRHYRDIQWTGTYENEEGYILLGDQLQAPNLEAPDPTREWLKNGRVIKSTKPKGFYNLGGIYIAKGGREFAMGEKTAFINQPHNNKNAVLSFDGGLTVEAESLATLTNLGTIHTGKGGLNLQGPHLTVQNKGTFEAHGPVDIKGAVLDFSDSKNRFTARGKVRLEGTQKVLLKGQTEFYGDLEIMPTKNFEYITGALRSTGLLTLHFALPYTFTTEIHQAGRLQVDTAHSIKSPVNLKADGGIYLETPENISFGTDNDHLVDVFSSKGEVHITGKSVDFRYARVFGNGPTAITSTKNNIVVGHEREIVADFKTDFSVSYPSHIPFNPGTYTKKIQNGAFVASKSTLTLDANTTVDIEFGELFSEKELRIKALGKILNYSGRIRSLKSIFLKALFYEGTLPDLIAIYNANYATRREYISIDPSDGSFLQASEDIDLDVEGYKIVNGTLLAGRKFLLRGREIKGTPPSSSSFIAETRPEKYTLLTHGWDKWGNAVGHWNNGSPSLPVRHPTDIRAGATIELNLGNRSLLSSGTMEAPLMVLRNAGNITLQGQQGEIQQVQFQPLLNLSTLFHKRSSVLYTVDPTGRAESLIVPDLPIGRPIPNLSPVIALTNKGIEINPDARHEIPLFTQVDLLQEGLMNTIMASFYSQDMRNPEDIFRWLRGNAHEYITRIHKINPTLLLRKGRTDEDFIRELFYRHPPTESFLYYKVAELKTNNEDILQAWLFNAPKHAPQRRLAGSGVMNAHHMLIQGEDHLLEGNKIRSLPATTQQNQDQDVANRIPNPRASALPTIKVDNGAINVTSHLLADGFNWDFHRSYWRDNSGQYHTNPNVGLHAGMLELIGDTFQSSASIDAIDFALHMDSADLSGTMNIRNVALWNVRRSDLRRTQHQWVQQYTITKERSGFLSSSSHTETVSILHKESLSLHISGGFHAGGWLTPDQATPELLEGFFTGALIGHLPLPESFAIHGAHVNTGQGGLSLSLKDILTMHHNTDVGSRSYYTSQDGFWSSRSESGSVATYTTHQPAMISESHLRVYADQGIGIYGGTVRARNTIHLSTLGDLDIHSTTVRNHGAPSLSRQRMGSEYWDTAVLSTLTSEQGDVILEAGQNLHFTGAQVSGRNLRYMAGGNIIDDALMVGSQRETHEGDYHALDQHIKGKASRHTGTDSITAVSGASQYWNASKFHSPATRLVAQASVFLNQIHDQHLHQSTEGSAGGLFESGTKTTTQSSKSTSQGVEFTAPAGKPSTVKLEAQTGSIQMTGAQFQVDKTTLSAVEGWVKILLGTNYEQKATNTIDADAFWQTTTMESETHNTFTPSSFRGNVEINSKETLLERVKGQTLEFADRIKQNGGTITYRDLQEFHDHQSKSTSGPTAALGMVIALGVALATGGAGGLAMDAGGFLSTTLGLEGTAASVATAMGYVGFTSLCTQGTMALVAAKGNIFEAAKNLAKAETLTNLALTMATAGLLEGISVGFDMGSTLPQAKAATAGLTEGTKEGVKGMAMQSAGAESLFSFQNLMAKSGEFLKKEALRTTVNTGVSAAMGEKVSVGGIAKGVGTSVLANMMASAGGDLHAEGSLSDVGQTAWHVGSGAFVGGLIGGTEGAIGSAAGNLLADLAFKALAPDKPKGKMDADEWKRYQEGLDRTAFAAKLFAPITIALATNGNAAATGASITTSSRVIDENHMAHIKFLSEQEQQIVDEKTVEFAEDLLDLQDRYGDVAETFLDGMAFVPKLGKLALGLGIGLRGVRLTRDLLSGDPERRSMAEISLITSVTRSKLAAFNRLAQTAEKGLSGNAKPSTLKAEGNRDTTGASTSKRDAAGSVSRAAEKPATTPSGAKPKVKIKTVPLSAEEQRAAGLGSGGTPTPQKGGVKTPLMKEVSGSKPTSKPAVSSSRNAGASSSGAAKPSAGGSTSSAHPKAIPGTSGAAGPSRSGAVSKLTPTTKALDLAESEAIRINKGPYHPRRMQAHLEGQYPGQVTSHTVLKPNIRNAKLAGSSHPVTGVPFDERGFPIFDKYMKYETRITQTIEKRDFILHMREATRSLREALDRGSVSKTLFNEHQLAAIQKGRAQIPDFTWHHHQESGRMQLIPKDIHTSTGHVGGNQTWKNT